jgi:hypothetical protein
MIRPEWVASVTENVTSRKRTFRALRGISWQMERDGRLTCEWRVPVRQGFGRKLQLVSARIRPGFPLAHRIQLSKRAQEFCWIA